MDVVINDTIDIPPQDSEPLSHRGFFYNNLLLCLGYDDSSLPVGDLLRRYHHLNEGAWLVVSPIHWEASHNDAMIASCGLDLQLSEEESQQWFTAFKEFVAAEDMSLHYHNAYTWLLQYDKKPPITAKPVYTLLHQSMMSALKTLDKTLFWQRFITECQMFFSAHPLNKERQFLSINGVWFWGDGALRERTARSVICYDEKMIKIGNLLSTHVSAHSAPLANNSLLMLDKLGEQEHDALLSQLQNYNVCWYWNNLSYSTKPKKWWSRLMEKMK